MHLIKFEFSEVSLLIFTKIDSERQPINDEKRKKNYQPKIHVLTSFEQNCSPSVS